MHDLLSLITKHLQAGVTEHISASNLEASVSKRSLTARMKQRSRFTDGISDASHVDAHNRLQPSADGYNSDDHTDANENEQDENSDEAYEDDPINIDDEFDEEEEADDVDDEKLTT
uniref:Uncharacterized protein n=1 Tax=Parascaris univalens TaxID=6257 RepID=A0A914ZJ53_PARUN